MGSRGVPLQGVQEVAGQIFRDYEPVQLPDPAATVGVEPYESIAEVVTQFARTVDDPVDRAVTDICFDRCLWGANRIVDAVATAMKDPELRPYSIEELDPIALVASRPLSGDYDVEPSFLLLHPKIGFPRRPLTADETVRVNQSIELQALGQPFWEYGRLMRGARRADNSGEYAQAVILACTSGEVLLNLTLRGILVETGRGAEIAGAFSERSSFSLRLRREFAPLLGGDWNTDRPGPVSTWVRLTQSVRHRVVHAGHDADKGQAVAARYGAEVLESFVFERLAERRYRYPKTALSALGEPGLRRRNLWNSRMQQTAGAVMGDMPTFWRGIRGV